MSDTAHISPATVKYGLYRISICYKGCFMFWSTQYHCYLVSSKIDVLHLHRRFGPYVETGAISARASFYELHHKSHIIYYFYLYVNSTFNPL